MIVGIDLGTTNSLVAVYRNGRSEVIPNRLGKFLTPSIISVDESGEILVGELAREYGYLHPESTATRLLVVPKSIPTIINFSFF